VPNLEPGTAYDVYLVSETASSHGVYGKVSAAMPFVTHAMAPDIVSYVVTAVDARSDSLRLAVSLSTSGILHYAVSLHTGTPIRIVVEETTLDANGTVTTTNTTRGLSAEEIVVVAGSGGGVGGGKVGGGGGGGSGSRSSETTAPPPYTFVATGQVAGHRGVQTTHVVSGLPPGTEFDVFLVSETLESGGVYGEVNQWASAFTHDVSPALSGLSVLPINGTAHGISLEFVMSRSGEVHYMVVPVNVEGGAAAAVKDGATSLAAAQGTISVYVDAAAAAGATTTEEAATEEAAGGGGGGGGGGGAGGGIAGNNNATAAAAGLVVVREQKDVYGLDPGTAYYVHLVPETSLSSGVFGEPLKAEVTTHRDAPVLGGLVVFSTDGSCTGFTMNFTLSEPGSLHYLVLPHSTMKATTAHHWGPDIIAKPEEHMSDGGTALRAATGAHVAAYGSKEYLAEVLWSCGHTLYI
jgi:hypothetical protein